MPSPITQALLIIGLSIALSAIELVPQAIGVLITVFAVLNITEDEMRTEK